MKPSKTIKTFNTIEDVAFYLWKRLEQLKQDKNKKHILLFAYNGIGKTRLSMAFKEQVKQGDKADTLYFNAFTEDLFTWDNDLENDRERVIKLNLKSNMLKDIAEGLEIKHKIRENLNFTLSLISILISMKGLCVSLAKNKVRRSVILKSLEVKKISSFGAFFW